MNNDKNNMLDPQLKTSTLSRLSAFGNTFVANGFTMYPVLILLLVIGAMIAPRFFTTYNLLNILEQVSVLGLTTIGLTFILLIGRLDLSLEGLVGFAPMLAAVMLVSASSGGFGTELPGWTGPLIALSAAGFVGWLNGFMVVKIGLNPFISTLGLLVLLRGGVLIISNGRSIYSPGAALTYIGSERIYGIPISALVFVIIATLTGLMLQYHRFGRALYAVGGNEAAARAAGINVDKVIWSAFIISGLLAGLAGIIMTGRLDSAVTTQGQNIIFSAFAAAVIGGVSLGGGSGTITGVISGVLLIGVINNLLTLADVPSFYVQATTGAVILVAAILTTLANKRSTKIKTRT